MGASCGTWARRQFSRRKLSEIVDAALWRARRGLVSAAM